NQIQTLEAKVHEIGHDQCSLDDRCTHQNHEHVNDRQMDIAEKDFEAGQQQEPNPDRNEQTIGSGKMLVNICVSAHVYLLCLSDPRAARAARAYPGLFYVTLSA